MEQKTENTDDIREYFLAEILNYISEDRERHERFYTTFAGRSEFFKEFTLNQLFAVYKLVRRGTKFEFLPCNPKDHVAVTFANMYVGIEIDGYTHS